MLYGLTYEVPPFRPPTEAYSLLIRATRHCSWNRCQFCGMYKGKKLEIRPVDEVKRDILVAKQYAQDVEEMAAGVGVPVGQVARYDGLLWLDDDGVRSAFIGDSNSIIMRGDELARIVAFLYEVFPTLDRVTSYGRAKTVVKKSPEELSRLRNAGLTRLHVGLETGDDELLRYVDKGATAAEMVHAGWKAKAAGFELSEYIMPGLGGKGRWRQHAIETAKVLNEIDPHFIRLRTLRVGRGTPLYQKSQRGEFELQSVEGLLMEVRTLIESLNVTSQLIATDFASNYYLGEIDGKLPEDKERMLRTIDSMAEKVGSILR